MFQLIDDRYRTETCVGTGAFGAVHRARDVLMDRVVALKTLSNLKRLPKRSFIT